MGVGGGNGKEGEDCGGNAGKWRKEKGILTVKGEIYSGFEENSYTVLSNLPVRLLSVIPTIAVISAWPHFSPLNKYFHEVTHTQFPASSLTRRKAWFEGVLFAY